MASYPPTDLPEVVSQRRLPSRQRFFGDLSQCLFDFVIQLLPTESEVQVKEDVRRLLERLIRTIEPSSRLLSFGSTANGFSLRNSDMDLCCLIDSDERLSASDLVTMLGDLLERETKFHVKPLPHARIPIVKLSLDPSPGLPLGIACDIGFENRLALENTRLLMCYAMIDPTRVRTLVLFLKVWSKRRKINSPYKGTLSSYGYVLLVIYFLVHVKNPPVLPNLQQMPPLRPISKEDTHVAGYNTWFFDDVELLRTRWHSENNDSVAELLVDFFRYFARDFSYNTGVASIRAGFLKKASKGWQNDLSSRFHDSRERNRLCIEDPFELDFNVGRCVSKDGIYTIRGEFMRASRILANRPERAVIALAELCAERADEDLVTAPNYGVSRPPPQTPYTVGSGSARPKASVTPTISAPTPTTPNTFDVNKTGLPALPTSAHMAAKRSKWTSPPPPDASEDAREQFETNLGQGLELATSSTGAARQRDRESWSSEIHSESASEGTSEVFTDTDTSVSDAGSDVVSVRSYTEGVAVGETGGHSAWRRPSWHVTRPPILGVEVSPLPGLPGRLTGARGRNQRDRERTAAAVAVIPTWTMDPSPSSSRRSSSGPPPPRSVIWSSPSISTTPVTSFPPLPPSPDSPHSRHSPIGPPPPQHYSRFDNQHTVFYQTSPHSSPRPNAYPSTNGSPSSCYPNTSHSPSSRVPQYPTFLASNGASIPHDVFPTNHPPLSVTPGPPRTSPTNPPSPSWTRVVSQHVQTHSRSSSSVTNAPTPKPHAQSVFSEQQQSTRVHVPSSSSPLQSETTIYAPAPTHTPSPPALSSRFGHDPHRAARDPLPDIASTSPTSSPTPSLSTGYETSVSMSPSPSPPLVAETAASTPKSPEPDSATFNLSDHAP
ncbi:hypothetical protein MIND_00943300 [Mycena indigotica]|uniref:polynucleotide adenylyltransferase n=1 Tax=Mycena indigotica TaxID=2126181 RepID=A0A8H6VWY0_9AGAR|nr:uncharacterized protein MIND_00943300 [Mycena indigotica]KAF7297104.1 hypothetical protein MIND_00943300 [Mycena indigotica]